jgi:hypothetical protein
MVSEIIDAQGEWSALASESANGTNNFLYFADPSGFAPVFYSLLPGRALVISDSFSGAVQGVRKLGGSLTLNLPNYVTLVSGKSATFQNLVSNETMANEIQVLGHNEALFIGPDFTNKIARDSLSNAAQISDYYTALSAGIEATSQSISTFYNHNEAHSPILTLTGGVDSRAVLALLSTTELASKFKVWSMDPRNAKRPQQKKVLTADVEIARELRLKYELDWMAPRRRSKLSLSFEEALAHYQSYNSNYSFTFAPANLMTVDERPILTLRGGGGEILRGTGGASIVARRYAKYRAEGGKAAQSEWAANHYLEQSVFNDATRQIAQRNLTNILERYTNSSMRQRIDAHYQSTRNRGHFGHLRHSESLNDRLMQVLTNPFLVRAASLSEYEYVTTGRVVADLFDSIDPSLRDIPFESAAANEQLLRKTVEGHTYRDRDAWQTEFEQISKQAQRTQFRQLHGPGDRKEDWNFDSTLRSIAFIDKGFQNISDLPPEGHDILGPFHHLLLESAQEKRIPLGSLVAKVASAIEILQPLPLTVSGRHLYCDPSRSDGIPSSSELTSAAKTFAAFAS